MSTESLKKLIDCERKAKTLVEEAKRECVAMRKKALADAEEMIKKIAGEQQHVFSEMEREMEGEINAKKLELERETRVEVETLRSNIPNTENLVQDIVDEICCNK